MCFIFLAQLNIIFMRPLYKANILFNCIINAFIKPHPNPSSFANDRKEGWQTRTHYETVKTEEATLSLPQARWSRQIVVTPLSPRKISYL